MTQACNVRAWPGFTWLVNHACASAISVSCLARFLEGSRTTLPALRWDVDAGPSDEPIVALDADGAVFRRAGTGDEEAWQELFERWKKPLLTFFYRSLSSQADAEELTLEVFVRLHRSAAGYEPRASFAAYLFHIARNVLLNELRRRKRKPAELLPAEAFDFIEAPGSESPSRVAELEEAFQRALDDLPENQRTLLLLIHQQQLTPAEAAAVVGLNPNAVRVQLHRARQRLKELMTLSHP